MIWPFREIAREPKISQHRRTNEPIMLMTIAPPKTQPVYLPRKTNHLQEQGDTDAEGEKEKGDRLLFHGTFVTRRPDIRYIKSSLSPFYPSYRSWKQTL